jgi:hypothetical protein
MNSRGLSRFSGRIRVDLEPVIEAIMKKPAQSPDRLKALADFVIAQLKLHGLPGAIGGSGGELRVAGLAREKTWDVAYEFTGKFRLLVSLKSMWKNAAGTIPNRLDDHMGETANIQQLRPEVVIGYVVVFDMNADSQRQDGTSWSQYFENALKNIAIRKAPLWNQGLLEGFWFIRIDSLQAPGKRVVDPTRIAVEGTAFFESLLKELKLREPAIPFDDNRTASTHILLDE